MDSFQRPSFTSFVHSSWVNLRYCAMAFVCQLWRERVTPMLLPQLPKLGSDCSSSELLSKKTQVQSAARQRDHVDRVGTELKMVFRLKF
jgi:hypothetical protein